VASYLHVARLFLATRPQGSGLGFEALRASDVIDFVLEECRHRSVGSAKYVVDGLRAVLRFCYLDGAIARPLADAVPAVASWRLAALPRAVDPGDVAALLKSCDRRTTFGRRDFAVLTLLVRLGLRSGEVAGLRLDDIDWRAGELVVRGKGPKEERLPLPSDVGEAIAGWLGRGRPHCAVREVFTRVRAPHQGLSPGGVSAIVRAACKRAGVGEVHAHRLRHTAATEMLRAGAGLTEIGQVLRHASVLTTSIYAKVDRSSLRALAKPWPVSDARTVGR
jgi:integrase